MIVLRHSIGFSIGILFAIAMNCAGALISMRPVGGVVAAFFLVVWLAENHLFNKMILGYAYRSGFREAQKIGRCQAVGAHCTDCSPDMKEPCGRPEADYGKHELSAWQTGFAEGMLSPLGASPIVEFRFLSRAARRIKPGETFTMKMDLMS